MNEDILSQRLNSLLNAHQYINKSNIENKKKAELLKSIEDKIISTLQLFK